MSVPFLARNFRLEIQQGATFLEVGGIEELEYQPTRESAEYSPLATNVVQSLPTALKHTIRLRGKYLNDGANRDAGQQVIHSFLTNVGGGALQTIRLTPRSGSTFSITATGWFDVTSIGGGSKELTSVEYVFYVNSLTVTQQL